VWASDEENRAEGQAQQRKGAAGEEAAQKANRRQTEKEAKEAEKRGNVISSAVKTKVGCWVT
jgi:hypothetical protein